MFVVYFFFWLFVIGVFCFGFFPFLCFFATLIHVSLFLNSFSLDSSVPSILMKSLRSSSHLSCRLPMRLLVFVVKIRLGFHVATLFLSIGVHSVWHFSWRVASSVFRCVSIQHGILNVFIFSAASCVLLLMYSIQSSVFVCSTCIVVCTAFKGGVAVLVTSDGRDFFHLQTMWTIHCCFFVVYHTASLVLMQS